MDIKEIERLLITTYRKDLYRPFIQAIAEYELIKPGDRIAVCISGGKDSLTMAKLMQEYQRHGQVPIEVVYIVMDPGFTEENVVALEENIRKWAFDRNSKIGYLPGGRTNRRRLSVLYVCQNAKRNIILDCQTKRMQQNRFGPPFRRCN